jgi:hypothetical protein
MLRSLDAQKACVLAESALEVFRSIGARPMTERAEALIAEIRSAATWPLAS